MLKKIQYERLNSRQQENYNFHKIASVLADYGFTCIRLSDDFLGADFIAMHVDGSTFLRVQLKGRLSFDSKYLGRGLHIAFREGMTWFLYPHDEVRQSIVDAGLLEKSKSKAWIEGTRNWPSVPKKLWPFIRPYALGEA